MSADAAGALRAGVAAGRSAAVVRPARIGDLPQIQHLLTRCSLPTAGVSAALADFVVAERGDRLVGVAGIERHEEDVLLRSVAVDEAFRGQGVARRLVDHLIDQVERLGARGIYLLTTTAEHYFPAFGFARIGRDEVPSTVRQSIEFRSACPATAVAMHRPAAPSPTVGA